MKISYRPEIDGLRAIAVICVILYHTKINIFGKNYFNGGFIGVDIFFVISGYLITSLILKELITTGSFSLIEFYKRRVRRILPPLLIVILLSFPFGWLYLLPIHFEDFTKSILSSLGFISNFYFHYADQQYGVENGLLKPFLHTWSLSVEEQFYFLFPIFLLMLYLYSKKNIVAVFFLLLFLSILFCIWGSNGHRSLIFYMLPSRGWELISGSILAYFEIIKNKRSNNNYLKNILPLIGLILIFCFIIFFKENADEYLIINSFKSFFFTLSPIVGVCLVIWYTEKNSFIYYILSSKLLVGIGIISYSLYLWHFPIFAFQRYKSITFTNLDIFFSITLTFALSILSYYFIEKPARNRLYNFKYLFALILVLYIFIIISCLIIIKENGFKNRFNENILNYLYSQEAYDLKGKHCDNTYGDQGFCIFQNSEKITGNIVLLGDSISHSILPGMIEVFSNSEFKIISMSYSGNIYLPGYSVYDKKNNNIVLNMNQNWHSYRKEIIDNLSDNTYIIIIANYPTYFLEKEISLNNKEKIFFQETTNKYVSEKNLHLNYAKRINELKKHFKNTILELSQHNKILLFYPLPQAPVSVFRKLIQKEYFNENIINYKKDLYFKFNKEIITFFDTIKGKNIHRIKTDEIFCPSNKCRFYDAKNIYFKDKIHPSYYASNILANIIFKKINNIENLKN